MKKKIKKSLKIIKKNVLIETFGTHKFKRSTQEILEESDKEDWN